MFYFSWVFTERVAFLYIYIYIYTHTHIYILTHTQYCLMDWQLSRAAKAGGSKNKTKKTPMCTEQQMTPASPVRYECVQASISTHLSAEFQIRHKNVKDQRTLGEEVQEKLPFNLSASPSLHHLLELERSLRMPEASCKLSLAGREEVWLAQRK